MFISTEWKKQTILELHVPWVLLRIWILCSEIIGISLNLSNGDLNLPKLIVFFFYVRWSLFVSLLCLLFFHSANKKVEIMFWVVEWVRMLHLDSYLCKSTFLADLVRYASVCLQVVHRSYENINYRVRVRGA